MRVVQCTMHDTKAQLLCVDTFVHFSCLILLLLSRCSRVARRSCRNTPLVVPENKSIMRVKPSKQLHILSQSNDSRKCRPPCRCWLIDLAEPVSSRHIRKHLHCPLVRSRASRLKTYREWLSSSAINIKPVSKKPSCKAPPPSLEIADSQSFLFSTNIYSYQVYIKTIKSPSDSFVGSLPCSNQDR